MREGDRGWEQKGEKRGVRKGRGKDGGFRKRRGRRKGASTMK